MRPDQTDPRSSSAERLRASSSSSAASKTSALDRARGGFAPRSTSHRTAVADRRAAATPAPAVGRPSRPRARAGSTRCDPRGDQLAHRARPGDRPRRRVSPARRSRPGSARPQRFSAARCAAAAPCRSRRALPPPRAPGGGELVEIAPPFARVAADQRQILRREQHRPQCTRESRAALRTGERLSRALLARPAVISRSTASSRPSLTTIVETIARSAPARISGASDADPMRAEGRRIPQRLNDIRLAEAVGSDEDRAPGLAAPTRAATRTGSRSDAR